MKNHFKFAIIGAGSVSFCPATLADILLNKAFGQVELDIALMDIAEAIAFDQPCRIGSVNMGNKGYVPGLPEGMAVELPANVDGTGIHPITMPALPTAVTAMIAQQGAIHELLIQAYAEKPRNKLLQAMLLDPTISNYNNAVALINEMCERQRGILAELYW